MCEWRFRSLDKPTLTIFSAKSYYLEGSMKKTLDIYLFI